jgi:hypothetical protein
MPWHDGVTFVGRGTGHAVGLCQAGAMARARKGASPAEILAFYYPGTELRRLARGEQTDPLAEGLLVTDGSRGGVLLPGEARSFSYQRAECLRKAGLRPGARATSYAFETWVAEVEP